MAKNDSGTSLIYLIDTNIFLELLLDQKRADEVIKFFALIEKGYCTAFYTLFTLHSILNALTRNKKFPQILIFLTHLETHSYFQLTTASSPSEEKKIVKICQTHHLDFDDATQYFFAKKTNSILVSFDKHFDKTDIKRVEPKEILLG